MPRSGGRVAVLLLLPGALPGPPAAGTPRSVKRLQGVGDPGPATRARNPAAAEASTSNQTSRPALLDCRQSTAPAHPLAHVYVVRVDETVSASFKETQPDQMAAQCALCKFSRLRRCSVRCLIRSRRDRIAAWRPK